ncbi:MAG: PBP1A family penicillin-binding protein, partial [Hyphomicrobiales bacterium]|nr:PBP1A family penicillin-binding protein [Hyphomicrobiales bacterium]
LTQQLAKNLFLKPERTLKRKIQEVVLAFWLETEYSKNEILEMYLNRVYLGAGAYGVDAASRRYFGKPAQNVTLAEAAVLAGLLKAPSRYSPRTDPERAEARAKVVLAAMAEEGYITAEEARIAVAHPARTQERYIDGSENYVADWVMELLPSFLGAVDEDIVVETTIDPDLQFAGEKALSEALAEGAAERNVQQGALVALDSNGAVKALVGGRSYAASQFNRAVQARRQPGSAFKPFVYLAALEHGLTPSTVRVDEPVSIRGWRPENYAKKYHGPVTLKTALALSLNTVAARVAAEVGPKSVVGVAQRLGIESPLAANPSIALGTSEVSPLELTAAYVPFSNGGYGVFPHVIERIRGADGRILYDRSGSGLGRIIGANEVAMMNDMMTETLLTGTGRRAEIAGWQAAGKTGTSQEFRDAWFVGYTAHLTAAVWFGNDDNSPTKRTTGGALPARTWSRFMTEAHRGVPVAALPGAGLVASADGDEDGSNPLFRHLTTSRRDAGNTASVGRRGDNGWIPPQQNTGGLLKRLFGG